MKLAALVLLVPLAAGAQPGPPEIVDLAAVMRLVREASPRIALERQAIAQAEAERISAGAYPNPSVSYARSRPGGGQALFEGSRQQDAAVELPLLLAGQRAARIERAERQIEAARARVAAGVSSLAAEAGAAFVALLAAQERVAVLGAASEEARRIRDLVAGRQQAGAASRYDLARIEVETAALVAKLDDARSDVAHQSGTLAALLGLAFWQPRAAGALAPLEVRHAEEDVARAPAALAATREEAAATSAIDVASRERWPVPALSLGRSWTSEPFGASNIVGVTVEVPLLDSRRGPLARARADARAAALRRELVAAEVSANARRLEAVIETRRAALERFEKDAASQIAPLRQMAEDAYRLGRGSLLELLDAARTRQQTEQIRVDLVAGLLEAQVRLLALLGRL